MPNTAKSLNLSPNCFILVSKFTQNCKKWFSVLEIVTTSYAIGKMSIRLKKSSSFQWNRCQDLKTRFEIRCAQNAISGLGTCLIGKSFIFWVGWTPLQWPNSLWRFSKWQFSFQNRLKNYLWMTTSETQIMVFWRGRFHSVLSDAKIFFLVPKNDVFNWDTLISHDGTP